MTMKGTVVFVILILLIIFTSFNECHVSLSQKEELYCGHPAIPIGANVFVIRTVNDNDTMERYKDGDPPHFAHDTIISYRCDNGENGRLIGDRYRQCKNGRWSGISPTCVKGTSSNLKALVEVIDLENNNKVINEGLVTGSDASFQMQTDQCLSMNTSLKYQWTIRLTNENGDSIDKINYFVLKMNATNIRNLWTNWTSSPFSFNITLHSKETIIECKPNENQDLKFEDETEQNENETDHLLLSYLCYDNFETSGEDIKEITIKLNQQIKDFYSFSLCQLKIYSGLQLCQRPDRPCAGIFDKTVDINSNTKVSTFKLRCQNNYVLIGNQQVRCNRFGQWLDELPVCEPQYCRKLKLWLNPNMDSNLMAGYEVDRNAYADHIPYARWLIFSCTDSEDNQTLVIKGKSKFICENGDWVGLDFTHLPQCVHPSLGVETDTAMTSVMFAIILVFIVIIVIIIRLYRKKSRQIKEVILQNNNKEGKQFDNKDINDYNDYDVYKFDDEIYSDVQDTDNPYQLGVYETIPDYDDTYIVTGDAYIELHDAVHSHEVCIRSQPHRKVSEDIYTDMTANSTKV